MHVQPRAAFVLLVALVPFARLSAQDRGPSPGAMRGAIEQSIPLLEKGSAGSADRRQCFTCHHQAIPVLAFAEARRRGFAIDEANFERQVQHTAAHLRRGRKGYLEGRGQGGKAVTAGYALWTLAAGGYRPDEVTAAVTHFLLEHQNDADHWSHPGNRPPSSGSDFTTTYVALRGLAEFGTDQQQSDIAARTEQVGRWLRSAALEDTEDRVFRLWTLPQAEGAGPEVEQAVRELIDSQRDDGGWAQRAGMESDAYATGTVLVALLRPGGVSAEQPEVRRGLQYLLDAQHDDGSWHVVTRADGFQTYFESGFPHGEDQFISMAASSWSTLALLLALPESPAAERNTGG